MRRPFRDADGERALRTIAKLRRWLEVQGAGVCVLLPEGPERHRLSNPHDPHVAAVTRFLDCLDRMEDLMEGDTRSPSDMAFAAKYELDYKLLTEEPPEQGEIRFLQSTLRHKDGDPRGLGKISQEAWCEAYRAWQGFHVQRGGGGRYSPYEVLWKLLRSAKLTTATSAENFSNGLRKYAREWGWLSKETQDRMRIRSGPQPSEKKPPKESTRPNAGFGSPRKGRAVH